MTTQSRRWRMLGALSSLMVVVRDSRQLGDAAFRQLSYGSLVLALLSLWLIGDWPLSALSVLFNLAVALVFCTRTYRRLPASLVIGFNIVLYLSIPILYIGYRGPAYEFAVRFGAPGTDAEYYQALPGAIVSLLYYLLLLVAGAVVGGAVSRAAGRRAPRGSSRRSLIALVALALFVAYLAVVDNSDFFAAIAGGTAKANELLPFLFLDHAFLMLFPFLLYGAAPTLVQLEARASKVTFVTVLLLFVGVFTFSATSKGALLNVAWYFFIFPLAYFYRARASIYWPSRTLVMTAGLAAVPMFIVAQTLRQANLAGATLSIQPLVAVMAEQVAEGGILTAIADRLSASFQNYVMIFARFGGAWDTAYAAHFAGYLGKSFANLVWLGTPYPEAYAPSSRLLASVLSWTPLSGFGDSASLLPKSNTQPYGTFGTSLILLGPRLTSLAQFGLGLTMALAYNLAPHLVVRLVILVLANVFVHVYGADGTLQLALHIVTASAFMLVLVAISKARFGSRARLVPPGRPVNSEALTS